MEKIDICGLEQDFRAKFPPEKYGLLGYLESSKHNIVIEKSIGGGIQSSGIKLPFIIKECINPSIGYDCIIAASCLSEILKENGVPNNCYFGNDPSGIFEKCGHVFCVTEDEFDIYDGTPIYSFFGEKHTPVRRKYNLGDYAPCLSGPLSVLELKDGIYFIGSIFDNLDDSLEDYSFKLIVRRIKPVLDKNMPQVITCTSDLRAGEIIHWAPLFEAEGGYDAATKYCESIAELIVSKMQDALYL